MITQRIVLFALVIYLCVVVKERAEMPCRTTRSRRSLRKIYLKNQVVGVTGVEPVTLRLSSACSNQLSYTPVNLVELRRFELLTYSLQSYRSTN
jgi:hypothetical protein